MARQPRRSVTAPSALGVTALDERLIGGRTGRILISSCVVMALTAPGQTAGLSVFINPVLQSLHVSRSALSAVYMGATLAGAVSLTGIGRALDRFGIRPVSLLIIGLFGVALLGFSSVSGLATVALAFAGLRMLGQGGLSLSGSQAVAVSFRRRRGTAMGIASAVGNAGVAFSPVLVNALIGGLGWRRTAVLEALVVVVVLFPVVGVGLRDLAPTGAAKAPSGDMAAVNAEAVADEPLEPMPISRVGAQQEEAAVSWTLREALRSSMFWAMAVALSSIAMLATGLAFNQVSLLEAHGLSSGAAAANFIPQTAATLAVSLVTGRLLDRLPGRVVMSASMVALVAALVAATQVRPGFLAVVYAIFLGTAGGGLRAQEATLLPRYYGLGDLGAIRGAITTISVAASAFGPLVLSLGRAGFGGYDPMLLLSTVVPVVAVGLLAIARDPRTLRPATS